MRELHAGHEAVIAEATGPKGYGAPFIGTIVEWVEGKGWVPVWRGTQRHLTWPLARCEADEMLAELS